MKKTHFTLILCFICFYSVSQNTRDVFIHDSISSKIEYAILKKNILKLEGQSGGYEPDFKYRLLNSSFTHNDILFFKKELSLLVEKYGFNVAYMSGDEKYYNAIMKGDLSKWFKKMYLKCHTKWLKNNFEKQIDLRKLNELAVKDQLVNSYAANVSEIPGLDSIQKERNMKLLSSYFYKNASTLHHITQKHQNLPTAKSFALVQNGYGIVTIHNLQAKANYDNYWTLFYPYYKKAYLKDQIDYMIFRNYDNLSYLHYGYQVFGLISIKNIPDHYRKSNGEIPIKDPDFAKKIKSEFKWY